MDDVDRAQEINEQLQGDAMDDHYRRMTSGISRTYCEDCGDPIPQARRKAVRGCRRCIGCQTVHEIHIHGRM